MAELRAIISAGMPGSGKEEFLIATASLGLPNVRMGDVVRDEKLHHGISSPTGEFAHREREMHGDDIWALRTIERLDGRPTIIDGCRSHAEVEAFRRVLGDGLKVIALHSDPETRYLRLVNRGREDAPTDRGDFARRDEREMSWGLAKVIALADKMIVNDTTLEEYHRRCVETARTVIGY